MIILTNKAIQDQYPEEFAHCYGCGHLNEHGLQIKSFWDKETKESNLNFSPKSYHTAFPGFVYGGLLASIIDCHGTATAAAAAYDHENRDFNTDPPIRFVTASLKVDYRKPTPLNVELKLKGKAIEIKDSEPRVGRSAPSAYPPRSIHMHSATTEMPNLQHC